MRPPLATFDCDGTLADFETRGFYLRQSYESLLEEHAHRGDLRLSDRDSPNHRVHAFADGIDKPLLGRDAPMWGAIEKAGASKRLETFGARLEAAKRADASFPEDAVAWDGTKTEMAYFYSKIAEELGLDPPERSTSVLVYSVRMSTGALRLEIDMGGRPQVAGRLPIYYHFRPTGASQSLFLSQLGWVHGVFTSYFTFVTGGTRVDGTHWMELDEESAVHGIRASLVALQSLAVNVA